MVQKLGKIKIDALYAGKRLKYVYNRTKDRREIWHRCARGDKEWVLYDARPARMFKESFIGPVQFFPAFVGILLDRAWSANGNPAPAAGNFVAVNEIGGGLILRCLGANIDDWIALHTGGNYPVTIAQSPHAHLTADIVNTEDIYMLAGLVGAANLETGDGAAWTVPDDGIWVEYDTSVDTNMRFVTRKDGVSTTTSIGAPPAGHSSVNIRVNDAGDEVVAILNGTIAATHTTHLPTEQLKHLAIVGCRVAAQKDLHLHDFRLIFDHGGLF